MPDFITYVKRQFQQYNYGLSRIGAQLLDAFVQGSSDQASVAGTRHSNIQTKSV
jgi:hypothetical protein